MRYTKPFIDGAISHSVSINEGERTLGRDFTRRERAWYHSILFDMDCEE